MISKETVLEVIQECADEKGVKMPDDFRQDFEAHMPNFVPLEFLCQIRTQLCARIKTILETDTAIAEKYAVIYSQISHAVRLKLACLLGFEDYITRPVRGDKPSRLLLKDFLQTLQPGESWGEKNLEAWKTGGVNTGRRLQHRVGRIVNKLNLETVMLILGEEGEKLLERNPFKKTERKIHSIHDARRYLKAYLSGLSNGAAWYYSTLDKWKSPDGVRGEALIPHILKATPDGKFTKGAIRAVLGKDADDLLAKNPFEPQRNVTSEKVVKEYLKRFLDSRPEGESWSPDDLLNCGEIGDSVHGCRIYGWIQANIRHRDAIDWMYVLIKLIPSEYLRKHPFRHRRIGSIRMTDAREHSAKPAITTRRQERDMDRITKLSDSEDAVLSPEDAVLEKERVTGIMQRENFMREIYKRLDPHECQLLDRFYAGKDIGEGQLLFLMGCIREIIQEHKPELI